MGKIKDNDFGTKLNKKHRFMDLEYFDEKDDGFVHNLITKFEEHGQKTALALILEPFCFIKKTEVLGTLTSLYSNEYEQKDLLELIEIGKTINFNLTDDKINQISEDTILQNKSTSWKDFRIGRLTASIMKKVLRTSLENPALSTVKQICAPIKFFCAATKYGLDHEDDAFLKFQHHMLEEDLHEGLEFSKAGLHIHSSSQFIAASPDGFVSCDCCGKGCIEIKCPKSLENKELIDDYLKVKNPCIELDEDGDYVLKKTHDYYYQVQTQMLATDTKFSYFVVWSLNILLVIKIEANLEIFDEIISKCTIFHQQIILPELLGRFWTRNSQGYYQLPSYLVQFSYKCYVCYRQI